MCALCVVCTGCPENNLFMYTLAILKYWCYRCFMKVKDFNFLSASFLRQNLRISNFHSKWKTKGPYPYLSTFCIMLFTVNILKLILGRYDARLVKDNKCFQLMPVRSNTVNVRQSLVGPFSIHAVYMKIHQTLRRFKLKAQSVLEHLVFIYFLWYCTEGT